MIPTSLFAAAVYLIPVAGLLIVRSRRDRTGWDLATDIVLGVAADLLGVLLLTRFLRLELAAIVGRGLWLAALTVVWARRGRKGDRPQWPALLDRSLTINILLLMLVGVAVSVILSRTTLAWDRDFHIPLVTALRGQKLPFVSMYQPGLELAYHYTGDAQSAMIQTYGLVALHSSLALSVAHDVMFALLGAVVGLAAAAMGIRRLAVQLVIFLAILLAGPMTLGQEPKLGGGYSIGNMLSLSFRPHVCLSFLLITGFVTAVLGSVSRQRGGVPSRLYPSLLAATMALAITDEPTLILLGLFLGVTWLHDPACLAPTRRSGALKLALLVVGIGAAILTFGGPLGLHAERYPISFIAPRAPSSDLGPIPVTDPIGRDRVVEDMFSVLGVFAAALIFVVRPGRRAARTVALAFAALTVGAIIALTCLDFNNQPIENHRWVTVAFVIAPMVSAFLLVDLPRGGGLPTRRAASLVALLIYASNGLAMVGTIDWMWSGPGASMRRSGFQGNENLYGFNCRSFTGARFGESPVPTYVDPRRVYPWIGCHPSLLSGPAENAGGHKIKTLGYLSRGQTALDDLSQNILRSGQPLRVACLAEGDNPDPICVAAHKAGDCKRAGILFDICDVAADQRARLGMR